MSEPAAQRQQATEAAWRIHDALVDWTSRVDTKATIVLGLESAAVTALATLSRGRSLPSAGPSSVCLWTGVGLLLVSVAACLLVVFPRLDGFATGRRWERGYVYFGHLRRWEAADLAEVLCGGDILPVLTRQLIAVSRICWRKHRLVQVSITAACSGGTLIAVGASIV
ncbi:Pycsar system effector family protein [Streptomyces sp. NPDC049916]|uniref:Pycsar system effector family protein n=1 Tax=unclassified Streptomyces TaxID=2593676 RepID=UPI00341B4B41